MSEPDERLVEVLADWYDRKDRGETVDPAELMRSHPDLADALGHHLAAQAAFDRFIAHSPAQAGAAPPRIGEFRILREMGRGGMGIVYEAEQTSMGRRVALKVLFPTITSSAKAVARFQREARAAGRLHHTNIVPVHAMGEEHGVWFYAMELVQGRALDDVIEDLRRLRGEPREKTPATPTSSAFGSEPGSGDYFDRLARTFAGVAEGLETAHQAGVVHRDVKPSNLVLDADGTLRITDFGLARVEGETATMTLTGDVVGTPAYMSPEQARAEPETAVDARTDVYSLGATLYEVLTLRPPFRGGSPQEICAKVLATDPVPPRRFDARIPRDLATIVEKAMEKEPARRYRSAAEMARDLRLCAEGAAIHARRVGPAGRLLRKAKRHKAMTALVVCVVLLASAVVLALVASRGTAGVQAAVEAHLRGNVLSFEKRTEEAIAAYEEAQRLSPSWLAPYEAESRMLSTGNRHRESLEVLERYIRLEPRSAAAHGYRGLVLWDLQRLDDAVGAFDTAASLAPDGASHHFNKGSVLVEARRWSEAIPCLERAVELGSDGAHHDYAVALRFVGRITEAVREAGLSVELTPDNFWSRVIRWELRTALGEHEAALSALEDDIRRFPDHPYFARLQTVSFRLLGRPEHARSAAAEGLARVPAADEAVDVAYLHAFLGRAEQARSWLAVAERTPDTDDLDRARVHGALLDRDGALRWIEAAAEHGCRRPAFGPPDLDFEFIKDDVRYREAMTRIVVPVEGGLDLPVGAVRAPAATTWRPVGTWETRAPLPYEGAGVALVDLDGALHAVGGVTDLRNVTGSLSMYDDAADAWTPKAPMPTPRGEAAVGVIDGRLYAAGGTTEDGGRTAALEAYDPASDTWTRRSPLRVARTGHRACAVSGKLVVVGGITGGDAPAAATEIYDPAGDAWVEGAAMPTPRTHFGAAVLDGLVFTVGGETRPGGASTAVEVFDPAAGTWSVKGPLPESLTHVACAVMGGRLLAVAGARADENVASVSEYDARTDTWRQAGPASRRRISFSGAVSRDRLYVAGGWCGRMLADVEVFSLRETARVSSVLLSPSEVRLRVGDVQRFTANGRFSDGSMQVLVGDDAWTTAPPLSAERGSAAIGVVRGRLCIAGGSNDVGILASGESFDPTTGACAPIAPMPTPRGFGGTNSAVVGGSLYVIGGTIPGYATDANEAYDPVTNTWSRRAHMPTARCALAVVAVGTRIYALGGTDTSGSVKYRTVEVYDPAKDTWSTAAPMPTGRGALGAGVVGGRIIAVGGEDNLEGGRHLSVNEMYDTTSDTWTVKAPLPYPLAPTGGVGVVDGLLYVVGGTTRAGVANSGVLAFDPYADTWTARAGLPEPRGHAAVAVRDGVLYCCGGIGPVHRVATVFAYRPNGDVRWTSSDPSVAAVDGDGVATALAAGTATITATTRSEVSSRAILTVATSSAPSGR